MQSLTGRRPLGSEEPSAEPSVRSAMRSWPLLLLLGIAGCGEPVSPGSDRYSATGELIAFSGGEGGAAAACMTCHGIDGMGDGHLTPRLAGLPAGYLIKQIEDYQSGRRADDVMAPAVRWLDDRDVQQVAAYYSAMNPRPISIGGPTAAGREVYFRGGSHSCAACHGPDARGEGAGNPALAGQPAAYLAEQLRRWRDGDRRNDPSDVMLEASRDLSDGDIRAVSAWASSQSLGSSMGSNAGSMPGNTSSLSIQ